MPHGCSRRLTILLAGESEVVPELPQSLAYSIHVHIHWFAGQCGDPVLDLTTMERDVFRYIKGNSIFFLEETENMDSRHHLSR